MVVDTVETRLRWAAGKLGWRSRQEVEAWGRGSGSRGLGSLGKVWEEAESQPHTGEVETLKGPRSGEGAAGSLWG